MQLWVLHGIGNKSNVIKKKKISGRVNEFQRENRMHLAMIVLVT